MTPREAKLLDRFRRGAQPVEDDADVGAQLVGALGNVTWVLTLQLLLNKAASKEHEATTPGARAFHHGIQKQLRIAIDNRKNAAQLLGRHYVERVTKQLG
jgi:hypothetical protein